MPRVLPTPFVKEWNSRQDEVEKEAPRLSSELIEAVRGGRGHELLPFTGQSTGIIEEILPTAEIVRRMVAEAEQALRRASAFLT